MPLEEFVQSLVKVSPGKNPSFRFTWICARRKGEKSSIPFSSRAACPSSSRLSRLIPRASSSRPGYQASSKVFGREAGPLLEGNRSFRLCRRRCIPFDPLPRPPENELALSSQPHVFSLLRQADLYRPYAVLAADSRQAPPFLDSGRSAGETKVPCLGRGAYHPVWPHGFVGSKISAPHPGAYPATNEGGG